MKKRRPAPDESTAYHEAGHVLVGHIVGFVISSSTIVDGGGRTRGYTLRDWPGPQGILGAVNFDPTTGRPSDDSPLPERLAMLYAGVVAQRLLCERRGVSSKRVAHNFLHRADPGARRHEQRSLPEGASDKEGGTPLMAHDARRGAGATKSHSFAEDTGKAALESSSRFSPLSDVSSRGS